MKSNSYKWLASFDNDVDALIAEKWANESLFVLENLAVMAALVHRDFEDEIKTEGDIVNAHRPASFTARRKNTNSQIVTQDVNIESVPVRLDQHWYTSFIIRDGEESKAFKSLVDTHLIPAISSLSQAIDRALCQQAYTFIASGNSVGKLGTTPDATSITAARRVMTGNAVPRDNQWFYVFNSEVEEAYLNIDKFVTADKIGDSGQSLSEGTLGRKYGFWLISSQNVATTSAGLNDTQSNLINLAAGYAVGTTSIEFDGAGTPVAGSWMVIDGDNTPQKILTVGVTTITMAPGLAHAVADNAVITSYDPALVNLAAGYAAGFEEELVIDDLTLAPQAGQLLSTGISATGPVYGSMDLVGGVSTTQVLPSRPLAEALVDNAVIGVGPAGGYNLAFHRNAIALVTRPLVVPRPETGVKGAVATHNNISVRVVIAYDAVEQGHRVTVDILGGITTLDEDMGCLVFS